MGGFAAKIFACQSRSHHFKRITIGQTIAGEILHIDGHDLAQPGFVSQPDQRRVREIHIVLVECSPRSGINQDVSPATLPSSPPKRWTTHQAAPSCRRCAPA